MIERLFIVWVLFASTVSAQVIVVGRPFASSSITSTFTDVIAYFKMDEPLGNAADATGHGWTFTDINTVGSAAGKVGTSRSFQAGVLEYFEHADNATLSIGPNQSFTWWGWLFPTAVDANYNVVSQGSDISANTFAYRLYHPNAAQLRWRVSNGVSYSEVTTAANSTPLSTWTFFRATLDVGSGLIELELNNNGTVVSAPMQANGCYDSTAPIRIGFLGSSFSYAGRLDEMGFIKRTLTTAEQAALYASGNGVTWPLP